MAKRYNRRSTRPIEDLPSLFAGESESGEVHFEVAPDKAGKQQPGDDFVVPEQYTRPRRRPDD